MNEKDIQFRIWQLNESILHLEDIECRCKDEEYKKQVKRNIEKLEEEKKQLYKQWEELRK